MNEDSLKLTRAAADLEDSSEKNIAMENRLFPMRQLLGDMLLEIGQPEGALAAYEELLTRAPAFLLRCCEGSGKTGDAGKAMVYYEKIVTMCPEADAERSEPREAKIMLARK